MRTVAALLLAGLVLAGCGGASGPDREPAASTRIATLVDRDGDGRLERGPGETLRDRTELAPAARAGRVLGTFGQIADPHVADEESPGRLEVLDRLGPPFASTFRPQEALGAQVLTAAVRALDRQRLDAVVETGDLADDAQANELRWAITALRGGTIRPDSGRRGYDGVQAARAPDPSFYRPAVDAPRLPGLLAAAQRPFGSPGLKAPWLPVVGNHDLLVAGILAPSAPLRALATGGRRIVAPPPGLRLRERSDSLSAAALDGRPEAARLADRLLREGRIGRTEPVTPDPARRPLGAAAVLAALRRGSGHGGAGPELDYASDIGPGLRAIVLDATSRAGGSGGTLSDAQLAWLKTELARAGKRWVVVFSHQPLTTFASGRRALALLDAHPRVLAAIGGHTHANRIVPRRTAHGGYWLITTASLADFPQQVRVFRARATARGAVLDTWLLDTAPGRLADTGRSLAYLDAQGGRPAGFRGRRVDRNVRLFVRGP